VRGRVVLVEDDADLRSAAAAALEWKGYEVYAAASCEEARAVARVWPPDAVVLDLVGAGDSAAAVRALGAPVLLASGSSPEYLAAAVRRLGAAAGLAKPYGIDQLAAALDRLVPAGPSAAAAAEQPASVSRPG
jgi:DNA-binding response OmpR family regulator